jgi:ABC-2 type transport system permease protein
MKFLNIAQKDLTQSLRNLTAIVFMIFVPLLVTLIFLFIFGGVGGNRTDFELPRTVVVIVNLDQGSLAGDLNMNLDLPVDFEGDDGSAESMGDLLVHILQSETYSGLMQVSLLADEATAISAINNQEAGVAVIIPKDFSNVLLGSSEQTSIVLQKDPTLTFGPAIVEGVIRQILDGFAAGGIGVNVVVEGLIDAGIPITPELIQDVIDRVANSASLQSATGAEDTPALIDVQPPSGADSSSSLVTEIVGAILGGMMVFFAFFTGANTMETILIEEERGTLPRLFTTPTSHRTILGGKAFAAVALLTIQIAVLLLVGRLVFGIDWGEPLAVLMAATGIVMVAAATGLFLVSLLNNTRQAGILFGGVLTLTGMLGLISVFTAGVPDRPAAIETASLFVPQGWAIRALRIGMENGPMADLLFTLLVLFLWTIVFASIGQYRMQRRFA